MRWPPLPMVLLLLAAPAAADEKPVADAVPFEAGRWQIRQGRWRFEPDGRLTCEGRGLSSLVLLRGARARDLDASVEVRFLGPESSAGLVFRVEGEQYYGDMSFYQLEWYTHGRHHGRRLSLMTKNPRWKQIVVPLLRDPPMQRWFQLRVRAVGDRLQAFVDGQRVFEKRDRTFLAAGRLGLHVFQARRVEFRGFRLTRL